MITGGSTFDADLEVQRHAESHKQLASEVVPIWMTRNYLSGSLLEVDELVRVVDSVLRCGASAAVPSVTITPRPRDP